MTKWSTQFLLLRRNCRDNGKVILMEDCRITYRDRKANVANRNRNKIPQQQKEGEEDKLRVKTVRTTAWGITPDFHTR